MSNYTYLLFDAAIALAFLAGPFVAKVRFWERWRNILFALGAVSLPFILWDITATYQKHWAFNEAYTLDIRVLGLPLEEILFFVVVPLACMFVWTIIERIRNKRILSDQSAKNIMINAGLAFVAAGIFVPGAYTRVVLLAGAIACILLARYPGLITGMRFWLFQLIALGLFVVANTVVLTGLPIVTYGEAAISGIRIGTIPIEDFLYNFALLNLFLLCFLRKR